MQLTLQQFTICHCIYAISVILPRVHAGPSGELGLKHETRRGTGWGLEDYSRQSCISINTAVTATRIQTEAGDEAAGTIGIIDGFAATGASEAEVSPRRGPAGNTEAHDLQLATLLDEYLITPNYLTGLASPLGDDRPIMNAVKKRAVSGVVWTNRTMVSSNTNINRTGQRHLWYGVFPHQAITKRRTHRWLCPAVDNYLAETASRTVIKSWPDSKDHTYGPFHLLSVEGTGISTCCHVKNVTPVHGSSSVLVTLEEDQERENYLESGQISHLDGTKGTRVERVFNLSQHRLCSFYRLEGLPLHDRDSSDEHESDEYTYENDPETHFVHPVTKLHVAVMTELYWAQEDGNLHGADQLELPRHVLDEFMSITNLQENENRITCFLDWGKTGGSANGQLDEARVHTISTKAQWTNDDMESGSSRI
ncbi:hypothetical protein PR048_008487 [Dryococelus australis]|uniref:Uncharacterized protein n=1 Tax=Dryococelus australis TaxID=614101 RepID=A0ABQ9HX93_9NEOP|nr:hypothetical protein PR048_008487 [Dryococelus australis]